MLTTLTAMFTNVFSTDTVVAMARESGAWQRLRDIRPLPFVLALVSCAMGDETRSIATARRMFHKISGFMPEESSFFDRFTEATVTWLRCLFHKALAAATSERRAALAELFQGTGVLDMLAIDATQVALPAAAEEDYPSTTPGQGGFKITATLSVLYQRIREIRVTHAKMHDSKALGKPGRVGGLLLLMDRGYASIRRFFTIDQAGGFFATPLKANWTGRIERIRCGLGQCNEGLPLHDRPYRGTVDIDASFRLSRWRRVTFRVVCVSGWRRLPDRRTEVVDIWLLTNLSPEQFCAEDVASLYRYRFEIEQLFRVLKTVGRLDQLKSKKPEVFKSFMYATLLGIVLAHDICAQMRRVRPDKEPSPHRVTALVLGSLLDILRALGTPQELPVLAAFERALWREGVNPNPGRPYTGTQYGAEIRTRRARKKAA